MQNTCDIPHPLKREGTAQYQRFPKALEEDYVKLDERSFNDLIRQTAEYAGYINYYSTTDANNYSADWKLFFEAIYDYDTQKVRTDVIAAYEDSADAPPHIALFLAFLRIFNYSQKHLNSLTHRHLDFFYQELLRLQLRDFTPDRVTVFYKLDKNQTEIKVPKGTYLKAGKDASNSELFYKTLTDQIVNNSQVAEVKTIFRKNTISNAGVKTASGIYAYPVANSADGYGAEFEGKSNYWRSFGKDGGIHAEIGFAIGSPILYLPDGDRTITLNTHSSGINSQNFLGKFRVYYTGPKEWVEVQQVTMSGSTGIITLEVKKNLPEVVGFDPEVHSGNFKTALPLFKIVLKPGLEDGIGVNASSYPYSLLQGIQTSSITITTEVEGSRSFVLQNDNGILNPARPFYPFGNLPVKDKSNLYISAKHIFNSYLEKVSFPINWKGRPDDLDVYYGDYTLLDQTPLPTPLVNTISLANVPRIPMLKTTTTEWQNLDEEEIPGKLQVLDEGLWKNLSASTTNANVPIYGTAGQINYNYNLEGPESYGVNSKNGIAKFILDKDFGHSIFANLITRKGFEKIALDSKLSGADKIVIPPPPYTPEFQSIQLNYTAETTVDLTSVAKENLLFHIHPFGYDLVKSPSSLVPLITSEGNLYIGLDKVTSPRSVSIYFHMLEDSGDPNLSLQQQNEVVWEYLAGDIFVPFERGEIIRNTTNKFLTSGIITFVLPRKALQPHTKLNEDLVWIRGSVNEESAVFPYLIDIRAQAGEAVFENRDNTLVHLENGLPALIIKKFENSIPGIKEIIQPFTSYGGKLAENKRSFYQRVSERLRHKHRAWNIWDYERLVLEQFPFVYKVKCVSHSLQGSEYAPGNVMVIVIPRMVNVVNQDVLNPRVRQTDILEIKEFLASLTSDQVTVHVLNPVYEEVEVTCGLKLLPEYGDIAYYEKVIKEELIKFFAPWTVSQNPQFNFGNVIYNSQIIKYIESLPYVDYISSLHVSKHTSTGWITQKDTIRGSNESVIITSAPNHHINANKPC